jgi:hypothetical protein
MKLEKTIGHVRVVKEDEYSDPCLYVGTICVLYFPGNQLDKLPTEIAEVVRDFLTPLAADEDRDTNCNRVRFKLSDEGEGLAFDCVSKFYVVTEAITPEDDRLPLHSRLCAWAEKERARWDIEVADFGEDDPAGRYGARVEKDGKYVGLFMNGFAYHGLQNQPQWIQNKAREAYEATQKPFVSGNIIYGAIAHGVRLDAQHNCGEPAWTVSKWGDRNAGCVTITASSGAQVNIRHEKYIATLVLELPPETRTQAIAEILAHRPAQSTAELGEWRDEVGDLWQFREHGGALERRHTLGGYWHAWEEFYSPCSRSPARDAARAWQQEYSKQPEPCTVWAGCVGGAR